MKAASPSIFSKKIDGYAFAHLFALGLYSYEKGIPATIQAIMNELKEGASDKPMLELPPSLS